MRYDKSQVKCYNCLKFGRYTSEYRAPSNRVYKKVNYMEGKIDEDGTLLPARNFTSRSQENIWYLNRGLNNHINGNISMFIEFNEFINGKVTFRDDSKVPVKEKRNIFFSQKMATTN